MLQSPGTGERALFGHVAHEHEGHALELGEAHDEVGAGPHLAEAARSARPSGVGHGLDRIDDHECRARVAQRAGQSGEVGGGQEHEPGGEGAEALGASPDLLGRLLGGHEQYPSAGAGHRRQDLEKQRRLPHPRFAAEQRHRARHQPAAQDPIELGQPRGDRPRLSGVDLGQGDSSIGLVAQHGPPSFARRRGTGPTGEARRGHVDDHGLLDEAVPCAAPRASTGPAGRAASTRRAPVHRPGPSHTGRLRTGCDDQVGLRSRRPPRPARPAAAAILRRCGRRSRRPPRRR